MLAAEAWMGRPVKCPCGQTHEVPIEQMVIGSDMLSRLVAYAGSQAAKNWLVVSDVNTHAILGAAVEQVLATDTRQVHRHVFSEAHDLLPDRPQINQVRQRIEETHADILVAVGSGVINDITRYASFAEQRPYIIVATAPSMDGYASSVAALQFDGLKTTLPAHTAKAIFADPSVLAAAPWELIQAGFGDLVGKTISLLDWKLAHYLYDEPFCPAAYELVQKPLKACIESAAKLRERDAGAVEALFLGLVNAGVAMAMVGNSRPCSGSEHHLSHYWDLLAYKGRRAHASHGHQVGYATPWMMRFYRRLTELDTLVEPKPRRLDAAWHEWVTSFYGEGAETVESAQQRKAKWLAENHERWTRWRLNAIHAALQPEFGWFPQVEEALSIMGLADAGERLQVDTTILRETFQHAWELRDRYTIFDFLAGQGQMDWAVQAVLR
ncbi:MAG: sn-glycerol-1-phosphate dehydrogenase [Alicyclobacillus herbarius]|uniref:sn-glycerol-1-phosphate dehydrogenase n=1 Tax=Alicyclobacillus herbarius TaxID=122960 RepID=UPI0023564A6D|nr:sn-glycerol-1-phosphate dehydrogenase [Alicyclobacillus herbarius]MCL6633897.1 sn-glycerol-1-phosphate dehydrogenase [Alicyclobacillus herbarius]